MRVGFLVFGCIMLLGSFALLTAGTTLLWINTTLVGSEGFLSTQNHPFKTNSYAIVLTNFSINIGETGWWSPTPSDIATIRLSGHTNDPFKKVFIGIAEQSAANAYLRDVLYIEITRLQMSGDPSRGFTFIVENATHPGDSPSRDPASETFWTASAHGAGVQTLEWSPRTGTYWIVLMNEDGSANADLTVNVGVKVPLLSAIGLGFLAGGTTLLMVGIIMIYLAVRPSPRVPRTVTEQPQLGTVIYCSKCGKANPINSKFCHSCGAEIRT